MAQCGGPLNDLLYLNTGHLAFGFKDAAGPVARAANVVNAFIQGLAPQMNISPEFAEQLGNLLVALAVDTLMGNKALGQDNRIDGSLITTSSGVAPTATATGCPDPKETSGEYNNCECIAPVEFIDYDATDDELRSIFSLTDLLNNVTTPDCNIQDLSNIPSNVFWSDKNNGELVSSSQHLCGR
ncbi:hypothetical protein TOPH_08079 [Tolypocladium ophioglossoides CBS 100239]|uniref:Uncharacterized protein n=1 Tax=Tolypocladium ophioglossoides (strain CBS 100239) TaxID=1163406 RepID=A0A0L0N0F4_TOLOC|nr:hypothetical protein TOPH_08079 [Tolypocladium ophioglossoides CBS 100239]